VGPRTRVPDCSCHETRRIIGNILIADSSKELKEHYAQVADIPTGYRAKTSLLVAELNRFYVAASGKGKPDAKLSVQVCDLQP
jgi:hypothetical protein